MKEKEVVIDVHSVHAFDEEGSDTLDFSTDGMYRYENGSAHLWYWETEVTGLPGTRTSVEIGPEGVKAEGPEGEVLIPGDTVAVALGRKPRREEADGLRCCAPTFIQLGDCDSPATIWQATEMAYHMLTDI